MNIRHYILLVLLMFACCGKIAANDEYKFASFMTTDGLSDNTVLCGLCDRYGFMWLGTSNGLNCFDGRRNVVYRNFPTNGVGLYSSDVVLSLLENGDDIWLGCNDGLKLYHRATGLFEPFRKATRYGVVVSSTVQTIFKARNGQVWIGTLGQGVFIYNAQTDRLEQDSRHGGFVSSICQTADGSVCLATLDGTVNVFSPYGKFIRSYKIPNYKYDKTQISLLAYRNNVWVGTDAGLYNINLATNKLTTFKSPFYVGSITSIALRDAHTLTLGTRHGLFTFTPHTGSFVRVDGPGGIQGLTDQSVNQVMYDPDGTMWVFTSQGGVNYLPRYELLFRFKPLPDAGEGDRQMVYAFAQADNGNMWVGATNGLYLYNNGTDALVPYRRDLIHTAVRTLLRDGNHLFIGTVMDGLKVLDLSTGELKHYYYSEQKPYTLPSNDINDIYKSQRGVVYVATSWGLCTFDVKTERFLPIASLPSTTEFVNICGDHEGNVWTATKSCGLYRYTASTNGWGFFSYKEHDNQNSLPVNTLTSVLCDSKGRVWVATRGGGLCQYDPSTSRFNRCSGVSAIINFMCEDSEHNLWVATERTLMKIGEGDNPVAVQVNSPSEMWRGLSMQRAVSYSSSSNIMFIGNANGFYTFQPLHVKNVQKRPVYVTSISLPYASNPEKELGDLGLGYNLYVNNRVELPYADNSFTLHFSSPRFSSAQSVLFDYMLKGVDKQWAHNVSVAEVTYANLSPGTYEFLLREAGVDGPVSHVFITVLPPWYLTWWAYLIYIVALALCAYLVWRYVKRTVRRRYDVRLEHFRVEQEKLMYQSKINFFVNLVHEIRTPLSLIVLPLERLNKRLREAEDSTLLAAIGKNVDYLLNITNQLLDFQKVENGKFVVHRENMSLTKMVDNVYNQFASYCEVDGKTLIKQLPDKDIVTAIDVSGVNKIMMNLMSNALKYANTIITVALEPSSTGMVCLSVSDDGPGVPDNEKNRIFESFYQVGNDKIAQAFGTGIGLSFAKALAKAHGGDLLVDDAVGGGTRFSLLLPVMSVADKDNGAAATPHVEGIVSLPVEAADEVATSKKEFTVLLVEDNQQLLDMTSTMLRDWYRVLRAKNGAVALEVMNREQVDVVVSDVMMPVMDGIELCAKVKGDINYSHIPLILLTAKTTIEAKVEGMKSGADVYLEKPFAIEQLHMQIENLLRLRQLFYKHMSKADGLVDEKAGSDFGINQQNMSFLKKVQEAFDENMHKEDYSIDELASALNMSRSTFYRKLRSLTGMSPMDFMRSQRLKRAALLLLEDESVSIADIAVKVGFNSASYFTKCFKQVYGVLPKDYAASKKEQ